MSKVVSTTFISCDLTGPLASTKYNFKRFFFPHDKTKQAREHFRRGGGLLTVLKPRIKLVKSLKEEN